MAAPSSRRPVIGVVGLIDDAARVLTRVFRSAGLEIVLLGDNHGELGGSEYLKTLHGLLRGKPPALDLGRERALQHLLVDLAKDGRIQSAHDCAEGGVAVTLAECCFDADGIGIDVALPAASSDGGVDLVAATLFGESASRVVVSAAPEQLASVLAAAACGRRAGAAHRADGRSPHSHRGRRRRRD